MGRLKGQASDTRGRGGAVSDIAFRLEPLSDRTRVGITTDLQLSGALAQYGRGAGMVTNLAAQIIEQFAQRLCARLMEARAPASESSDTPPPAEEAPPVDLGRTGLRAMVENLKSRLGRWFGARR